MKYLVKVDGATSLEASTPERAAEDAANLARRLVGLGLLQEARVAAIDPIDPDKERADAQRRLENVYADVATGEHFVTVTMEFDRQVPFFRVELCGPAGPSAPGGSVGRSTSPGEALHLACHGKPATHHVPSSTYALGLMRKLTLPELLMMVEEYRQRFIVPTR